MPSQPRKTARQLELPRTRRRGRPRKPDGARRRVRHRTRPWVDPRAPIHITLVIRDDVPALRDVLIASVIETSIARGQKPGFRIVHYSIQRHHIHLFIESTDRISLARGVQGLCVRIARGVNRLVRRSGKFFADRYHASPKTVPREVRHALAYILLNYQHHEDGNALSVDHYSSGPWFGFWAHRVEQPSRPPSTVPPRTWLLRIAWMRPGGLLCFDEGPCPMFVAARQARPRFRMA